MVQLNRYIDHTLLKPTATAADIEQLCNEAKQYRFASVCVNPYYVPLAKKLLSGSGVLVCTVIGFPLGANATAVKALETAQAERDGCDEFDMVINVGALKAGCINEVERDIRAVVEAAGGKTVKVIIETYYLTPEEIAVASRTASQAGAAFVKTCTGFNAGVATVENVRLMKQNVAPGVRIKASAGIRSYEQALALVENGAERLGTSAGVKIVRGE